MGPHAPHVRTKKPLRGRRAAQRGHALHPVGHHAAAPHKRTSAGLVRRGPAIGERSAPFDTAFHIAAAGVILAAALLGAALGLARPTWMLAAAMAGLGALLAIIVAFTNGPRAQIRSMP